MKPEKLLDGMQHISPEYITEAKPAPKQQTENSIREQSSAGKTDTASRSHTTMDYDTKEKDYIMKKNTITHRIMTGFAATVACAVFACGGWFIYKQAQQQELNPDGQSVTEESRPDVQQATTNFLGGQGEIRILGEGVLGEPDPYEVLYDDTRWYFCRASCYADRAGENADGYRSMPAEITAYYANVLNDGSNFYYAEEQSLYTLDDDGTRSDEPFFQLTDDMLDPSKTAWRPLFSSEDTEADPGDSTQFFFRNVVPMSENKCLIVMSGPPEWFMAICDRESGDVQVLPISGLADPEPTDTVCSSFLPCADGSVMAVLNSATMKHAAIIRISPDGSSEVCTRFSGDMGNNVKHFSVTGNKLYVLLESYDETDDLYEYKEIDLSTHDIVKTQSLYDDPDPWVYFAFSDAERQQEYVVKMFLNEGHWALYAADPGWESMTELYRMDNMEADRLNCWERENSVCKIISAWADAHYVVMRITDEHYVLYDLGRHTVQFIRASDTPEGEADVTETDEVTETDVLHVDESQYTELDPGFTGTNFLGGQGSLHIPKTPSLDFIFDETNYYYFSLVFPRSGNHCEDYHSRTGYYNQLAQGCLISDGERLYVTKNGTVSLIDSSGKLTPFFTLSDAGISDDIRFTKVFRVGSSYLFCWFGTPESYMDKPVADPDDGGYIWVDENGMPLSSPERLDTYETLLPGSPEDSRSNYVYCWNAAAPAKICRLANPASGEEPLKFTLPDWKEGSNNQYGYFSAVIDDKFLYLDKGGAFCGYDPNTGEKAVLVEAGSADTEAMSYHSNVIDGKICFVTDQFSEQPAHPCCIQYDLNTGERKKLLSFDADMQYNLYDIEKVGSKLMISLTDGPAFFDPESRELFRLQNS